MVGTPGYMAPEQVTGNGAVPATDVWAWACCVVFAARGDHLFDGDNILDIARRILDGPGPEAFGAVHRLSPRLVPVLRRATAQEVGDRPRDGAALLRLLDRSGATVPWVRGLGPADQWRCPVTAPAADDHRRSRALLRCGRSARRADRAGPQRDERA